MAALALVLVASPAAAKKKKSVKPNKGLNASEIFFKEGLKRLKGKNVCFITNAAGLGRYFLYDAMEETDKYIHAKLEKHEIKIAHLFTPEHGLTGQEDDHGNAKSKAGAPETIYLTTVEKLQEKIADCEALVLAIPAQACREVLTLLAPAMPTNLPVVIAAKGIERSTFLIDAHGVLRQEWRATKADGNAATVLEAVRKL